MGLIDSSTHDGPRSMWYIQIALILISLIMAVVCLIDAVPKSSDESVKILLDRLVVALSVFMMILYATVGYPKEGPIHIAGCIGVFILTGLSYFVFLNDGITLTNVLYVVLIEVSAAVLILSLFRGDRKLTYQSSVTTVFATAVMTFVAIADMPNSGMYTIMRMIVPIFAIVSFVLFCRMNEKRIFV